jgi:hypothetical protein
MNVKETVAGIMTRADEAVTGDKLDQLIAGLGKLVTRMDGFEEAMKKEEPKKEEVKADAASLSNSVEGEKLDKVLTHLDSLHGKHDELKATCDAMNAKHDALSGRMDAFEAKQGKEAENVEQEGAPTPVTADAAVTPPEKSPETALKEEREENGLRRNDMEPSSAMFDSVNSEMKSMREYIAKLERTIPKEMPEAERTKFVDAQVKADRIAQAFGDSAGAPRWQNGETHSNYVRRLLAKYKVHSPAWKEKDLAKVHDSVLDVAEVQIYADAWTAATKPATSEGQPLREIITSARTGRKISSFVGGDPEACWGPFKLPSRKVKGFTPPPPPPVVISNASRH